MTAHTEYSNYLSILDNKQHLFRQNYADAMSAFDRIFANFIALGDILRSARDSNNKTHVSLWTFLPLMQRQSAIAFDGLTDYQSFAAWVSLRPCLEAALIIGKWVDDHENAKIWLNRETDRNSQKLYRNTYEGQTLRSHSLPSSDKIQTVLKLSNDDYMHMNLRYYDRHLSVMRERGNYRVEVQFFDDDAEHQASIYAMLHLLFVVQDALLAMFTALFTNINLASVGLAEFESEFKTKVDNFLVQHPTYTTFMKERGLWSV